MPEKKSTTNEAHDATGVDVHGIIELIAREGEQ